MQEAMPLPPPAAGAEEKRSSSSPIEKLTNANKKAAASQRPDVVQVGAEIMHVWEVEMKTCLFSVEMCIYSRWRCPDEEAAQAMEEGGDGLDESWEPDWYPRIKVWNMAKRFLAFTDDKVPDTDYHKSKVWISAETTICCQITEDYDLLAFPFELQDLNIKIEVENAARIEPIVKLPRLQVQEPVMTQIEGVLALPDFTMNNDIGASYRYRENSLQLVLVYEREFQYYLWNCYIIVGGLTTLIMAVYTQPPDVRMEIDITLLLVGVTFKVLMSEQLPPVSYLTFLDWYNLVGVLFIFIGVVLHGVTSYFETHHSMPEDDLAYLDTVCMWCFIIGWIIFNFLYFLAVQAQLEMNDAMTELPLIKSNGYAPMQLGEDKPDGTMLTFEEAMNREADDTTDSVYGKFAGQGRVSPGAVFGIIFNLMRGIKHKDAAANRGNQKGAPLLGLDA